MTWKIVRDTTEDGEVLEYSDRFFSAMGRDVSVTECQLDYTEQTRSLMVCGTSRADRRARSAAEDIVEIMADPANRDGLSRNQLVVILKRYGHGRDGARRAIAMAVEDRILLVVDGPNRTHIHTLNPAAL